MKIKIIHTTISIAISLLIAYGFYSFHDSANKLLLSVGSFILLAITMIVTLGVEFKQARATTNIRVVSSIAFVLMLVSQLIFSFFNFTVPSYLITNGILALVYLLVVYSVYKSAY